MAAPVAVRGLCDQPRDDQRAEERNVFQSQGETRSRAYRPGR